jgi:hypothetical protein
VTHLINVCKEMGRPYEAYVQVQAQLARMAEASQPAPEAQPTSPVRAMPGGINLTGPIAGTSFDGIPSGPLTRPVQQAPATQQKNEDDWGDEELPDLGT